MDVLGADSEDSLAGGERTAQRECQRARQHFRFVVDLRKRDFGRGGNPPRMLTDACDGRGRWLRSRPFVMRMEFAASRKMDAKTLPQVVSARNSLA